MLTAQLSECLKAIAASAAQLPQEIQNQIAAELDDALWDAQLRDPDHLAALRILAEAARRERKLPMQKPSDTGDAHRVDPDESAH